MYVGGTPEYIQFWRQKKETTMQFSEEFKESIVQKLLIPGGQKASELSKEIGVSKQTLYNWRDKYILARNIKRNHIRSPRQWKMKDKYNAVLDASNLSNNELGKWLREKGLHSEHLNLWKREIETMVSSPKDKEEIRKLKKHNKELEKDLKRKEKALAEMAALLTLKKKAAAIWGDEEE